jgi:hypothetical protein
MPRYTVIFNKMVTRREVDVTATNEEEARKKALEAVREFDPGTLQETIIEMLQIAP